MRISAVIATYNCAGYLPAAIRSVLDQTRPPVELIVVDDGSTDETPAAVAEFGAAITYIRTPNQGAAAARNVGLTHCSGDAVAFLDADDVWYEDKLAWQVAVLERHPEVAAVCADFGLVAADLKPLRERFLKEKYRVFRSYGVDWPDLLPECEVHTLAGRRAYVRIGDAFGALFRGNFVNTSSIVVRRGALSPFASGRITQEDYELWLKVSLRGRFALVDRPLLLFRMRPGQLTSDDNRFQVVKDTTEVVETFLPEALKRLDRNLVRRRFQDVSSVLAIAYLGIGASADARRVLRASGRSCGWSVRTASLLAWSWMPTGASATFRRIVRRWMPRG